MKIETLESQIEKVLNDLQAVNISNKLKAQAIASALLPLLPTITPPTNNVLPFKRPVPKGNA